MADLEKVINDVELGLRIAKGTDCGLFKTSVKSAEQILELLKEQKNLIDGLIEDQLKKDEEQQSEIERLKSLVTVFTA